MELLKNNLSISGEGSGEVGGEAENIRKLLEFCKSPQASSRTKTQMRAGIVYHLIK
ncbi:MAG: hypothetical protein IKO03_16295 [Lachnospiraceae bacterium]|nr:hypothetical protein [Lachnospiraceae bacterium]